MKRIQLIVFAFALPAFCFAQQQERSGSASGNVITLSSVGEYSAMRGNNEFPSTGRLRISDPTVLSLSQRLYSPETIQSSSGIIGMPKRAYGFRNGRLMLQSTGATSSGTITGSGTVGTGSSLGNIGSRGGAIGLNGKSPYAGVHMWGNARGMQIFHVDSSVRQATTEKEND